MAEVSTGDTANADLESYRRSAAFRGYSRPPVLLIWDRPEGIYAESAFSAWCIFRPRTAGGSLGEMCAGEATCDLHGIPLCSVHYKHIRKKALAEFGDDAEWRRRAERFALEEELSVPGRLRAEQAKLDARKQRLDQRERKLEAARLRLQSELRQDSVIYYLRRTSDGLIKIGTSRRFAARLNALRGEHGQLQLLLAHAGSYEREDELHGQFAALRVEGEWFRPEDVLLRWIISQRRRRDCQQWEGQLSIWAIRKMLAPVVESAA